MQLLLVATAAMAGPWVHAPGTHYSRIGYGLYTAGQAFDEAGERAPMADERFLSYLGEVFQSGRFTGHSVSTYHEVGVFRPVELYGSLPYRVSEARWRWMHGPLPDVEQENHGFGDISAGARAGGTAGSWAGSLGVGFTAPLYDNHPRVLGQEAGNMDFTDDRVALGTGTISLDLRAAGGVGFGGGWAQLETGASVRDRDYSTLVPLRVQAGARPHERVAVWLDGTGSFSMPDGTQPRFYFDEYGKGPTVIDGQSFVSLGGGAMVDVYQTLALEIGASRAVWGRRIGVGTTLDLGLSWRTP